MGDRWQYAFLAVSLSVWTYSVIYGTITKDYTFFSVSTPVVFMAGGFLMSKDWRNKDRERKEDDE